MPDMDDVSQRTSESEDYGKSPPYQLANGRALRGDGGSDCDYSQGLNSRDYYTQLNEFEWLSEYSSKSSTQAVALAATPTLSQHQVSQFNVPSDQLAGGGALQGNGDPDCDSQYFMGVNPQEYGIQLNASGYYPPEPFLSTFCTPDGALAVTSTQSRHQVALFDARSYQLASGGAPQGNDDPDCDISQCFMREYHDTQLNASGYPSEPSLSRFGTPNSALAATPAQSQHQVAPFDARGFQLANGGVLQENGGPNCDSSQCFMREYHDTQFNASEYMSEPVLNKFGTPDGALAATPTQSQHQVAPFDARSYKLGANPQDHDTQVDASVHQYSSVPDSQDQPSAQPIGFSELCPASSCLGRKPFSRTQELERHIETHLAYSIYCPFEDKDKDEDCDWLGRRQVHFKDHWLRSHQKAGEVPGKDKNMIYDPSGFVYSIRKGTPVDREVRSAYKVAKNSLIRLGKPESLKILDKLEANVS